MGNTLGGSRPRVDYDKDKRKAEKYLKRRIEKFERRLNDREKDIFRNITIDGLREVNKRMEYSYKVDENNRIAVEIDKLFQKSDKSKDIQYIYSI